MVASTRRSTHATTQFGPSVPLTCPPAGSATTAGGAPAGAAGPAAARNARTLSLITHCSTLGAPGSAHPWWS
jgi:hypothetical protein